MRNLNLLDVYRLRTSQILDMYGSFGDHENGVFEIPSPIDFGVMKVLASVGSGWEHVSVSRKNRCPNWIEMEHVKRIFFHDDECCMQLHVPLSDYVSGENNGCIHCLHIWKPTDAQIPRPPKWMVGGMTEDEAMRAIRAEREREES